MSSALMEVTRRSFGDHADAILDAGAVFPVNQKKIPALGRGVSWKDHTDPNYDYKAWGFAIKTGSVSGITVVDFDTKDATPSGLNVATLRGSHVWVPSLDSDRNSASVTTKVDVRGNGGYAVFSSPNHQVLSTSLNSRDAYSQYLSTTKVSKVSKEEGMDIGVHFVAVETNWYLEEVQAHGYEVDVPWVVNRLAGQMAGTGEGLRNITLFKNTSQIINLGATEEHVKKMIDAAYDAGLDGHEIMKTVNSARKYGRIYPMFHRAQKWSDRARAVLPKSPVIEELVRLSTEQHNTMPLVSKKGMEQEAGIPLSTIKRHLNKLEEAGLVREYVQEGYRMVNGRPLSHANNYKLVVE